MTELLSIDAAISVENRPTYNIDWELTFLCNMDCSYCVSHDNSTKHPDKNRCKKTIDFFLSHADLVMSVKKPYERSVTVNILGGEVLIHPDIVEIFQYLVDTYTSKYKDKWVMNTHVTTNGVVGKNVLAKCLPLFDQWVVSYHTEGNDKQRAMAVDTIYFLKQNNAKFSVRLMMHSDPEKFNECIALSDKFTADGISHTLKTIGEMAVNNNWTDTPTVHTYTSSQSSKLINYWNDKTSSEKKISLVNMEQIGEKYVARSAGRPCCSEKSLCANGNQKNTITFVPRNDFRGWYCSVNWYFLFIKQTTENIYYNRACRAKPDGTVGPIGTLDEADTIIENLSRDIDDKNINVIRCPKPVCGCGICAPKAQNKDDFERIIKLHLNDSVLKY